MLRPEIVYLPKNTQPMIKSEPPVDFDASEYFDEPQPQVKIGEIFRVAADEFLFACTHCDAQFALYAQFVVHTETHFRQFLLHPNHLTGSIKSEGYDEGSGHNADVKPSVVVAAEDTTVSAWPIDDWHDATGPSGRKELNETGHINVGHHDSARPIAAVSSSYECGICKKKIGTAWYLEAHMKLHTTRMDAACPICDRKFAIPSYVSEHIKMKHKINDGYRCDKCDVRFRLPSELQRHQRKHRSSSPILKREYECHQCHQTFDTLPKCYNHLQLDYCRPVLCVYCDTWQASVEALRIHRRLCQRNDKTTGQAKYKVDAVLAKSDKPHEAGRHQCGVCGKRFMTKHALSRHVHYHSEERDYQCDQCPKSYKFARDLRRHMEKHTGDFRYGCKLCDYRSSYKSVLQNHSLTVHGQPLEDA